MKFSKFFISFIICFGAAALGSAFTASQISTWYPTLNKPFFNPPNWIFGPVWTLLYTLMAVSLYLVWTKKDIKSEKRVKKEGLQYFILQLALNSLWSVVFFGMHSPLAAFIIIACLWGSIIATIQVFLRLNKTAGQLLIPYFVWVSFASILNIAVVILN